MLPLCILGGIAGNPVVVKQELLQNPAAGLVRSTSYTLFIDDLFD